MNRIWRCRIGFLTLSMVLLLLASTAFVWQPNGGNVPPPTRDASVSREELQTLYISTAEPLNEEQQILYNSTVKMLLKEDLWTERDMYDAVHYLMIPMHYAFRAGDEGTVSLFADFFTRFTQDITTDDRYGFQTSIFLNRLQFYYFSTQFMCLCAASGRVDLIPDALPAAAYDCAETYLLHTEANWHTEDTVIEHLRQMLAGKEYPYSYYSVTEDLDGFTLAILCDLNCFAKLSGKEPEELTVTAAQLVYEIYASPLLNQETELGGWLLQVGAWSEHPDYAYAGNAEITPDIQPKTRNDVPWDSSHFARWPLYLRSYMSAQTDHVHWDLFVLRRKQLANQMVYYVLKNVDGHWLTTTFMDGTNGVYRYSYHEDGVGLEGYALSGTFLIGWWSLLEDSRITEVYQDILETFPMKGDRSNPYFDYATVREQNPFFDDDTAFDNGMMECMVACASKISPAT